MQLATDNFATPSWVQNAVFYQIFPDSFARSDTVPKPSNLEPWDSPPSRHGFKGGDLIGVAERLDYLEDLGVTAIYLCPIFQSTANHRYHTHDYYAVDPILGGNQALATLLDRAHRRNMRIVLDGVFNHASRGFYQFSHLLENDRQSPYLDWFTVQSWPLRPYGPYDQPAGYDAWWGHRELPKLNTRTVAVREFIWRVATHWVEQGIDGWRLDVPSEIDDDSFWQEFRRQVKTVNPEAYLVGEIWGDARRWLAGDQFDAVMNYPFTRACLRFFAGNGRGVDATLVDGTDLFPLEPLDALSFQDEIEDLLRRYPLSATYAQLNLLGSHDTARFLTIAREDESSLRLAILFQMTFPGAPCIYYGDEVGMLGGRDPDCRRAFLWDATGWNHELRDYVKRCVALRHTHPVLRLGDYTSLHATSKTYAFARRLQDRVAIITLNASESPSTIDVDLPACSTLIDVSAVWGDQLPTISNGAVRAWQIPARSGAVLVARAE